MSNYSYTRDRQRRIISIMDLYRGTDPSRTVTNDIEAVVESISTTEKILPEAYHWIYRDTAGYWDGWDPVTETFVLLNTKYLAVAAKAIREKIALSR